MSELVPFVSVAADADRWKRYRPRPDDLVIATAVKSGTTLTPMLCALLIFDGPDFPAPMDDMSPWFDMVTRSDDEVLALIEAQRHRRFLKTHTPLDAIELHDAVTYVAVVRDPRDVFVSWTHHMANMDTANLFQAIDESGKTEHFFANFEQPADDVDEFDHWMLDDRPGSQNTLRLVLRQAQSAWERRDRPNVCLLHYADMRTDIEGAMRAIADTAGIDASDARLAELAAHAGIDRMRARGGDLAPNTKGIFTDPVAFFRSGTGGEWREQISDAQHERYWERVRELCDDDLSAWLHRA